MCSARLNSLNINGDTSIIRNVISYSVALNDDDIFVSFRDSLSFERVFQP